MIELGPLLERIPARTAVYFHALRRGIRQAHLADRDFPAASVIKVPILLELYRQAQQGGLAPDERIILREQDKVGGAGVLFELHEGLELTLEDLARLMLVVSDNTASNLLLERIGRESVNASMRAWGMAASTVGRRFMEPARPGHDNRTTATDMGRCLEALASGEILAEPWRGRALEILRRQQYREKIPLLLPADLVVAHKTGELDGVRHDAALVELPEDPYVLVLLTEDGGPPWEVDRGLAELSQAFHQAMIGPG